MGVDPPPCLRGIFSWCPVTLGWEGRKGEGEGWRERESRREGGAQGGGKKRGSEDKVSIHLSTSTMVSGILLVHSGSRHILLIRTHHSISLIGHGVSLPVVPALYVYDLPGWPPPTGRAAPENV